MNLLIREILNLSFEIGINWRYTINIKKLRENVIGGEAMPDKRGHILKQVGVLAMAGVICRIIGVVYRIFVTYIIGNRGNGYYGFAYNAYAIVLLITSYSIPGAVSKVMAERLARKEYRNAQKVFYASLLYVIIVGGLTSVLTFFAAPYVVSEQTARVLRVFCPTIFFSGILGVYRGYFQAHRTMVQSSVSQIIEQIVNAIVSISMAAVFVSFASKTDETSKAVNGAIGSALGTGAGVLSALLFMIIVYRYNGSFIKNRMKREVNTKEESYQRILKGILTMVTPIILSTFIYNLNTTLNAAVFEKVSTRMKLYDANTAVEMYGVFSGKTVVLINVPIALASALATALLPNITGTYTLRGEKETAKQINYALKMLMIVVIPIAVGMFLFAGPIMEFLYQEKGEWELAAALLRVLSIDVIFISSSTLSNVVLQAIGQPKKTVINASISLVIQTILLIALLVYTKIGVYALPVATVVYAVVMCGLNGVSVRKALQCRPIWKDTYVYPFLASLFMGVVSISVYLMFYKLYPSNRVSFVLAVIIAMVVYFGCIIKIGVISVEELKLFPKGKRFNIKNRYR